MLKRFTAQNFDGGFYTALDFTGSNAFLFFAKNGDISVIKRCVQLMWASTAEDGINLSLEFTDGEHQLVSTRDNIFYDEKVVRISDMENIYKIKYPKYSKSFILTYTQLLNLELARIKPNNYLGQFIFKKSDSKSYYSPLEDVFYDIEQARKHTETEPTGEITKIQKIAELESKIQELEDVKNAAAGQNLSSLDYKVQKLEQELQRQKEQDELMVQKDRVGAELDRLDRDIHEYEKALTHISKVEIDMNKYNSFMKINAQRVENDLAMFSYRIREREKALSDMANMKRSYPKEENHNQIIILVVLLTLSLGSGLALGFLSNPLTGVVLGLVLSTLFIGLFTFKKPNVQNLELVHSQERIAAVSNEIEALKSAKSRYLQNLGFSNEDDYLATKAVVRAMLYQKESDLGKVHEHFGGRELSDFKSDFQQRQRLSMDLQNKIEKYGPVMSPEDYIRKRRELDLLKMKSEEDNNENIDQKIKALREQLYTLQSEGDSEFASNIEQYSKILSEYYGIEISVGEDFVTNIEINNYEQKVELFIIQRLAYIISSFRNVELPMILEDPFAGVENNDLIKKILDFCSSKIQLILISEHESYDFGMKKLGTEI